MSTVVLYHAGCNDGIVSAWAAYTEFNECAKYIPFQYGDDLPLDCIGADVIMVDLSIKVEQLSEVRRKVKSLLIIDHHKSALPLIEFMKPVKTLSEYQRSLKEAETAMIFFDLDQCGSTLAWNFFQNLEEFNTDNQPPALKYIKDYDLWVHQYPETKAINAWLSSSKRTINRVGDLMIADDEKLARIASTGRTLLEHGDYTARSVIGGAKGSYVQTIATPDGTIAFINGPHHLRNELAELLKHKYDVIVVYTERDDKTVYSVRSNGKVDVSLISERFGGGGHAKSSAFTIKHGHLHNALMRELFKPHTFFERIKLGLKIIFGGIL